MSCADLISALSNVVVAGAATAAAVIAWRGLNTWRDQLSGTVEYDLARRVLKGVYRVRDAVDGVRISFMFAAEMPEPPKDQAESMSNDQIRYYGISKAYQTRWNKVIEAYQELDADLLEAEVIWGPEIKTQLEPVRTLNHELLTAVRHHLQLQNPDESPAMKQAINKIDRSRRDVLYMGGDGETDQFAVDYSQAIKGIENYLRPHLRRP